MTEWTESARRDLDAWSQRVRDRMAGSGADADEVVDDLRAHVTAEVEKRNLRVVNSDDLRQILGEMGEPERLGETPSTSRPAAPPLLAATPTKGRISLLFFGTLLPVITLAIELGTHMCAGAFFNPIPTWWHVLIVALVPLINFFLWRNAFQGGGLSPRHLNRLSGFALGAGAVYSLMFLPLMIPGAIAIVFLGWGLLPWSPFLSFVSTLRLRSRLRKSTGSTGGVLSRSGLVFGLLVGILTLLAPEVPSVSTRLAMQWADSEDPAVQRRGIAWLRTIGHDDTMLQVCYNRSRRFLDVNALLASPSDRLTQEEARNIYFRVTGRPFNSVPPPKLYTRTGRWDAMDEDFTWEFDEGLGGDAVAGRVRGLSMIASRLDGVIESDAGVGYYEWIMEFRNDSRTQREARAQIALPPGGVVSRLTLWINGEEREAAFGGRSQVREAYQKVAVQQRRDPVLVTTAGPDRVLMQCFPVPPDSGTMKLRVGITAPLHLQSPEQARLAWPRFLERNFNLAPQLQHSVWMESRAALSCASDGLHLTHREDDRTGLQGELSEEELSDPANTLGIVRAAPVASNVWTATMDDGRVEQTVRSATNQQPGRLVIVVDGSQDMRDHLAAIGEALATTDESVDLRILVATDTVAEGWRELVSAAGESRTTQLEAIRKIKPVGGQDNVAALRHAWDLAAEAVNGTVLWIHGSQPVLLESVEGLRQRLERNGSRTRLIDFQTGHGPNRVAEKLDGLAVQSVLRAGSVETDLKDLLASMNTGWIGYRFARIHYASAQAGENSKAVSKHIARLWANDEVSRFVRQRKHPDAIRLAGDYQLVTPVSGAVVLETQAQYDLAGLTPVDAATVPVVPEPSTWLLLILGLVLFGVMRLRRRHRREAGA